MGGRRLHAGFRRRAGPGAAEGAGAGLSGSRYSLRGGWRGERLFAGLSVTQADWRAEGAWDNPATGGGMRSRFDAAQRDLRLGLGGGLSLVPQAEAFAGEVEREGHMAGVAAIRAGMAGWRSAGAACGRVWAWRPAGGRR